MKEEFDFLAIGDTVVDAFIKLSDAHIVEEGNLDHKEQMLCMPFATKIPYEDVTVIPAVGNSANAAVSAARLGLKSSIVTFLGNDANGRECKFALEQENVDTHYIVMENGKKTNYHYVLWFQDERTILIKHESFKTFLPDIGQPKWVYLSSLGEHAKDMHLELARYLKDNPNVKLAFQPGTFQMKLGTEFLKDIYKQSEYFCCNVEEAQKILNIDSKDLPTLLLGIEKLGPKIITITDGKNGAYLRYDNKNYFQPNYPDPKAPLERTGAGDAFTSTFVSMLCLGHSPVEALKYAPINSMHVVQFVGAQRGLLNKQDIDQLLKEAPADYGPKEI